MSVRLIFRPSVQAVSRRSVRSRLRVSVPISDEGMPRRGRDSQAGESRRWHCCVANPISASAKATADLAEALRAKAGRWPDRAARTRAGRWRQLRELACSPESSRAVRRSVSARPIRIRATATPTHRRESPLHRPALWSVPGSYRVFAPTRVSSIAPTSERSIAPTWPVQRTGPTLHRRAVPLHRPAIAPRTDKAKLPLHRPAVVSSHRPAEGSLHRRASVPTVRA
jgi:hypothetical protein